MLILWFDVTSEKPEGTEERFPIFSVFPMLIIKKAAPQNGAPLSGTVAIATSVDSFLPALLAYEVSRAEANQHCNAAAQWGFVGVLVALQIVVGKHRFVFAVAEDSAVFGRCCAALEQAASIIVGESGHTQSEDDCDCQY
jgi:hypothetical protein